MIDLMEIGRRLWEDGEPETTTEPVAQGRQAVDLLAPHEEPAADPHRLRKSATIRNPSAAGEPQSTALSANPQNPQTSAPMYETEAIITALIHGAGCALGKPLSNRLRDVLAPMGRLGRASLAAAIDDAFEAAQSIGEARQQVAKLLDAHTPRQPHRDHLACRPTWIDWIAERCPLVPEDRVFILRRLHTLPPKAMERAARRYVATWQAAANAEPQPHRKANRGRTAANRSLLALIR